MFRKLCNTVTHSIKDIILTQDTYLKKDKYATNQQDNDSTYYSSGCSLSRMILLTTVVPIVPPEENSVQHMNADPNVHVPFLDFSIHVYVHTLGTGTR
jgi:hypothetical protein